MFAALAATWLVGPIAWPARAAETPETPAPGPCGPAHALPAYVAHDWKTKRPRLDALELGYLGVEADVVLVTDTFMLANDPKQVNPEAGFESTYLWHFLDGLSRCKRLQPDPRPFLVLIADRAPTPESRLYMASLLGRYRGLLKPVDGTPIAEFILTGAQDTPATIPEDLRKYVGFEWRVTSQQPAPPPAEAAPYRLLGIDWRKEIGWDGAGQPPAAAKKLVAAAVAAAKAVPGTRVRAYNVPSSGRAWAWLLDAGVDLVGVDDPVEGARLLADRAR
jgi:hypothetical protein